MAPFFDRVYEEFEQDWKDLADGRGETLQQYEVLSFPFLSFPDLTPGLTSL